MIAGSGELAALSSALIWAIASFVYSQLGRQMPPMALNLTKNGIAIVLMLLTLWLRGSAFLLSLPALVLLLLSGVIGIGVGDTAFFLALNLLGARRALLLESLAPVFTACLALLFLNEQLPAIAWLGIALTIGGVTWVIIERTPAPDGADRSVVLDRKSRPFLLGLGAGVIAALGQAIGAILSRAALVQTPIRPLESTLIRLLGGAIVLLAMLTIRQQSSQIPNERTPAERQRSTFWQGFQPLRSPKFLTIVAATALMGTYLGIWLQQIALKYTAAGIAQALGATSPLFVIPIAISRGDRVSLRAILGVFVAIAGIWLLFNC